MDKLLIEIFLKSKMFSVQLFGLHLDLLQVSLRAKMGEGIKARETCNTWQPGSLSSRHPFRKNQYPIICLERTMIQQSEALRCFLTMADSSFDETVDNNRIIFENGSKARLLMNINEHAKYYKSLSLFPSPVFSARETCSKSSLHLMSANKFVRKYLFQKVRLKFLSFDKISPLLQSLGKHIKIGLSLTSKFLKFSFVF